MCVTRTGSVSVVFNQREEGSGPVIDRPVRIPIILWGEWRSEGVGVLQSSVSITVRTLTCDRHH